MIGRRSDIQKNSSLQPIAYLEGLNIPAGFKLPPLHAVYEDAARRESQSSSPDQPKLLQHSNAL